MDPTFPVLIPNKSKVKAAFPTVRQKLGIAVIFIRHRQNLLKHCFPNFVNTCI